MIPDPLPPPPCGCVVASSFLPSLATSSFLPAAPGLQPFGVVRPGLPGGSGASDALAPRRIAPSEAATPSWRVASDSAELTFEGGRSLRLTAAVVTADEDAARVTAQREVRAVAGPYVLEADRLEVGTESGRGEATGNVRFRLKGYVLAAESVTFDVPEERIKVKQWKGRLADQLALEGEALDLAPERVDGLDTRFTPCLADQPSYFASAERLSWFPRSTEQNVELEGLGLWISGFRVFGWPGLRTKWEEKPPENSKDGNGSVDTQVGFNAFEGAFASGRADFRPSDRYAFSVLPRLTQGRGLYLGTLQRYDWTGGHISGDLSYQTAFSGGTSGLRGNGTTVMDLGPLGGLSMAMGFRSDLAGQAVDRLPEVSWQMPDQPLGPFALGGSARWGIFRERLSVLDFEIVRAEARTAQLQGVLKGPRFSWAEGWSVQPALVGQATRYELYGGDSSGLKDVRLGVVTVQSEQRWTPAWRTGLSLDLRDASGQSPFFFDQVNGNSQVVVSTRYDLAPTWYLGGYVTGTRLPSLPERGLFVTDSGLSLNFEGPCLAWTLGFRPLTLGVDLNYRWAVR
ncbi:MAG: hypothetical protein VKO21_03160 [Candidatus Sericytochromatia bacterium]|nr:hypothetical protein [Candidatus Sericytochromatia bacterium]